MAKFVKQTLMEYKWKVLPHPAYSPDLTQSDYHLFRWMQYASTYRGESAALGHFSVSISFGHLDSKESQNKYSSIAVKLFDSIVNFFVWFLKKFYMYKVNLNIFWHLAQDTLFGWCLGPQFSTHFSIIKTEQMKDYSTQYSLNLWKNEKRLFFMNSTLVSH